MAKGGSGKSNKKLERATRHGSKKVANPKIVGTKEHRHCGPLGKKLRKDREEREGK